MASLISNNTRFKVLNAYKQLLRVQREIFNEDLFAMTEARNTTYKEFSKNKNENDESKINDVPIDVTKFLKSNVAQAVLDPDKSRFSDNESIKNSVSTKELKERMSGVCCGCE
ncbi:7725_t:CDS:2 [Diversispora eburnea]|uniref:Mitochondrial zinc maintenance protein 1, mitochondrial n=1 Tax=Diversispora eburnea TaxID=1213867 RepID=A0A9N9B4C0_9GLOM|nr:7725_t:CDS:2 [Diversispora eburnea]